MCFIFGGFSTVDWVALKTDSSKGVLKACFFAPEIVGTFAGKDIKKQKRTTTKKTVESRTAEQGTARATCTCNKIEKENT